MKKRILSMLLCLCMVLALIPATAMAEGPVIGDIDGNGQVTNYDAIMLQNYLAGLETLTGEQLFVADFNGDGHVDSSDLSALQSYLGLPTLAVTVSGFRVGNTPADITLSFASTIPGVTFSEGDIQSVVWARSIFDGVSFAWKPIGNYEAFEAGASYRIQMELDNKGLTKAPAVTVNGRTPEYCTIATRNGVPIQLQIGCTLGTPVEQYTVEYIGSGDDPICMDTKTHGEPLTLRGETFKMDGFVQTGWVDKETGAAYRLGDTYTENADVTLTPVFEKIITLTVPYTTTVALGDVGVPGEKTFTLALIGDSAPDKDKSNVTITGSVTTNGKGSYNGTLTFTGTERTLWVMLSEGAFVQQVNAGEDGWTVDDTVWGVLMEEIPVAYAMGDDATVSGYTVYAVPASIDGNGYYYIDRENLQAADMAFTNIYTKSVFEPTEPIESDPDLPQTGDNSSMILRTALLLISGSAVIGMIAAGKKKKYNR